MDELYLIAHALQERASGRLTDYSRMARSVGLVLDGRRRLSLSIERHAQYDAPTLLLSEDDGEPVPVAPAANLTLAVDALAGYLGLPELPAEQDENVIPLQRP